MHRRSRTILAVSAALSFALFAASCAKESATSTRADGVGGAGSSNEASMAVVQPPAADAQTPADFPGLHNVVAYGEGVYSGSVPYGEDGAWETLRAMGIRTIISVDGALPDVEAAATRGHGMRYVHLPIGYNGMDEARTLEIARAIRDLEGPVYVHCHHGKHRSAGAAGAAQVTLGRLTSEQAIARMKVSGTSPNYVGLYRCVEVAEHQPGGVIDTASSAFPERSITTGMVQAMVEIDHTFEHLKEIEKAGWAAPADHPDLVPAAEAGHLADLYRNLQDDADAKSHPAEMMAWLLEQSAIATALEDGLVAGADGATLSGHLKQIADGCKECHAVYRDAIVMAGR
jgi:protein tyrosine phosphatase (PTP) superfamily phosphohydrolase (DUF442 family)